MQKCETKTKLSSKIVDMAQIVVLENDESASIVLGSCIGLAIHDSVKKLTVIAHIVLAESQNREGPPGKYADTAIPNMLEQLRARGSIESKLVAKIAGGANMFGGSGPLQVGASNYSAVKALIDTRKIPVLKEHVGGRKGRRVTIRNRSFEMDIECPEESLVRI